MLKLALVCAFIHNGAQDHSLKPRLVPNLKNDDQMIRLLLDATRRGIVLVRGAIEVSTLLYPQDSVVNKRTISLYEEDLRKLKDIERELLSWQKERLLNPGVGTDTAAVKKLQHLLDQISTNSVVEIAPPPREVKR